MPTFYEQLAALVQPKREALEKLKPKAAEKEESAVKLRTLLTSAMTNQQQNLEREQKLLKELDNLNLEVNGLKTQPAPLSAEIASLAEEIKKRKPPELKGPAVVVQPGGSGLAKGSKVFFVEASGGRLTYYYDETNKGTLSAAPDVIAADAGFNQYLAAVKNVASSKLMFLLREDGMGAYNNGAGWAQANHGFASGQVTKLPLPGRGEIDLRMFRDFLGTLPPPPPVEKKPAPPGAPGTAPAPPGAPPAPASKPAAPPVPPAAPPAATPAKPPAPPAAPASKQG
jgi:hypothetical protein